MIWRFDDFELDGDKVELRRSGAAVAVEPQVFALLVLLVENRERMVSKDEIIEKIWSGRFISDSAVASRIKSARQALGDDGRAQRFIKTIHGQGFRFVSEAAWVEPIAKSGATAASGLIESPAGAASRPAIAVLPFRLVGVAGPFSAIADALPHDLIVELSRLRWLFVIARGSSFRFRGADVELDLIRAQLNVRYCLTGVVEVSGDVLTVSVELADTVDKGVVWSDRFRARARAVHEVREEIVRAVVAALELQIPLNEAQRARLSSPEQLDAWSAFHLGVQHMYRFNQADNAAAAHLFERAVKLEPSFARAYAGLSFTHFQDAFLAYTQDVSASADLAQKYAELCLERDPVEPFGNYTMGRAFWLKGDLDASLPWLDRANALNPNYAQAKYARAWTDAMRGDAADSQANADAAMALSPLDPLLYGMLAVRSFSHLGRNEMAESADWAERAARSPGAHALIEMIAASAHALNGDDARARFWVESAKLRSPGLTRADFERAFPFRDPATQSRVSGALGRFGF